MKMHCREFSTLSHGQTGTGIDDSLNFAIACPEILMQRPQLDSDVFLSNLHVLHFFMRVDESLTRVVVVDDDDS